MKLTRLSFFYLIGYLVPAGAMLLLVPDLALKLLHSKGSYGDTMPRMTGGAILALGVGVVQIARLRIEVLYTTTLAVRVLLLGVLGWLFARTSDPFFAVVAAVVVVGMTLTSAGYLLDAKSAKPVTARA